MSKQEKSDRLKLGFLAAVEVEGRGHVGGLLVTNHNGRPLEFQCTTPVKPDRTQEILYGKSLRPWLLGELIGKTLLARTSIKPDVVFTTDADILELRNHTNTPVACTSTDKVIKSSEEMNQRLGGRILTFHDSHQQDMDFVADKLDQLPGQADLEEPLERVNEALSETVKTVMAR